MNNRTSEELVALFVALKLSGGDPFAGTSRAHNTYYEMSNPEDYRCASDEEFFLACLFGHNRQPGSWLSDDREWAMAALVHRPGVRAALRKLGVTL